MTDRPGLTLAPELEQKIRESATDGPMVMLLAELDAVRLKLGDVTAASELLAQAWSDLGVVPLDPDVEVIEGVRSMEWIDRYPAEARDGLRRYVQMCLSGATKSLIAKLLAGEPGARNYVTIAVSVGEGEAEQRYSLTLQRESGLAPATVIADLKADNDALRARVAVLEEAAK